MNDRAQRIANLSPEQRRRLELMLQEHTPPHTDKGIPQLPRYSESGQPLDYPLSPSQRRHWFIEQARPGALNIAPRWHLHGPLDVPVLETSLREICGRHEALRTTFSIREGEPVQVVGLSRSISLTQVDLRELPPPAREKEAGRLLVREAQRPFDLSHDLMLRATLLRLDDEEHVLLPVMPHIVSDGWSVGVLFRELWALYNALRSGRRANLPELPVQHVDYVMWQRLQEGALRQSMEYWKKQLADVPVLQMPVDRPRLPGQRLGNAMQELRMSARLLQELRELCRRHNVTLYMTLLAAWATLLQRYSRENDIAIATTFASRNPAEVEGLIGCFAHRLLLRHDLAGDPSFAELLGRVREIMLEAFSHGELPFEKIREELKPKLKVAFALQDMTHSGLNLDGLQVEQVEPEGGESRALFRLVMFEGADNLTAKLGYHTDLYDASSIARMLGHFRALLEGIVANPEQRISELLPLTEAELPAVTDVAVEDSRRRGRPARLARDRGRPAPFRKRLRRISVRFRKLLRRTLRRTRRAVVRHLGRAARRFTGRR